jgi:hypothetical protein
VDDEAAIDRMRQRLNRVSFATPHGLVEISWASRQLLIDLLREEGFEKEVAAIEAVGVSVPVVLEEPIGRDGTASVITGASDTRALPVDLLALRDALRDA